jgi:pantoate--beta-alanine ligase
MGALHDGHARLIARARGECGFVVVSIFVNPLQFDREDDLRQYPRMLDVDVRLCRSLGVNVIFAPAVDEMYPSSPQCVVDVGALGERLCGQFRPGHFRAVATVVLKLFQIVQADRAYFGEKDAQQLAIVRRLVNDLNVPTAIVAVPTVREPDGLAMSSRNRRLAPADRDAAVTLYRALARAKSAIAAGETEVVAVLRQAREQVPQRDGVTLEYLEVVDPRDMQPVSQVTGPVLVAGALWVGAVRLIDNVQAGSGTS